MKLPKIETNNPIITMNSITIDDIMSVIDRLNKVPDYNDLLKENKQLKMIVNEYERLNKGFKITNVQEYNIDELLSYKNNWNKLKMWLNNFHRLSAFEQWEIVNKMQELEGSDSNE